MLVSVVIDIAGAEADMMEVSCGRFSECAGSSEKSIIERKKHKSSSNTKYIYSKLDVWFLEIQSLKIKSESQYTYQIR